MINRYHTVCSILMAFSMIIFLGCQTNNLKEIFQKDVDDLQKQIFELQQDQAYLNTKAEQVSTELSRVVERMDSQDKMMATMEQNQEDLTKGFHAMREDALAPKQAAQSNTNSSSDKRGYAGPKELYNNALQFIQSNQIDSAIPPLREYLDLYPRTELSDNAQYWLGECYYKNKDFNKAVLEFKKVISDYPGGNKTAAALLKLGYSYYELRQMPQALESLQRIISEYPDDPVYPLAQKKIDLILSEK